VMLTEFRQFCVLVIIRRAATGKRKCAVSCQFQNLFLDIALEKCLADRIIKNC